MVDTLLLRPSLHFTQLNFTPLHYTCRHLASSHLNFTQLHFTTLSSGLTPFKFPTILFHLTSLHCTFRWFSPFFYSVRFTPFVIAFITLFLKFYVYEGKFLTLLQVVILLGLIPPHGLTMIFKNLSLSFAWVKYNAIRRTADVPVKMHDPAPLTPVTRQIWHWAACSDEKKHARSCRRSNTSRPGQSLYWPSSSGSEILCFII
jgi:hypothetical protein